jgi:hypothetical protein
MVTVCAWCERYLGARETDPPVTHGICDPCTARQRLADTPVLVVSPQRAELTALLEHLLRGQPAIRVIVDRRAGDRRRERGESVEAERRGEPDRRRRGADAFLI